jgi:hypothetical protein
LKVNPSTPRPEGRGLLRVDPERRFFTPPSKAGLGAAEWVNCYTGLKLKISGLQQGSSSFDCAHFYQLIFEVQYYLGVNSSRWKR